jgi:hypothetical protein
MKTITLFLLILLMVSCDTKVDDKFIINEKNLKDNTAVLKKIHQQLKAIDSINAVSNFVSYDGTAIESLLTDEKDVNIRDSVKTLFDPKVCTCPLPEKIANKLNSLKDEGKNWAPPEVNTFLEAFPVKGKYLKGKSVNSLLHKITIKSIDGTTRTWPLLASPTYKNFDFEKYLLKSSTNSFMYTLDCSGYINAAIQASAKVPGADITAKAGLALEKQKSMFVGGGTLISPINAAIYPDAFTFSYSKEERLVILNILLSIPDVADSDQIIIPNSYEVIWISRSGTSNFNGQASLGGGASGGFGVASINSTSDTGGQLTRKSSFTMYDTYLTDNKEIPDLKPFTIKQVRDMKKSLEKP